jgi:hypothetical protein
MSRFRRVPAAVAALGFLVASCAGPGASPSLTPSPSVAATASPAVVTPSAPATPSGVVAIGHSGLTGEGAGGRGFSWATGDEPEVNSVWLRIQAIDPGLAGSAVNRAEGGAPSSTLTDQATAALAAAPTPALVIVSTIDNDIRCDGTDDAHIPELGANVRSALETITTASPETKILVVGQFGRPSPDYIRQLIAKDPTVIPGLSQMGRCSFFDADGEIDEGGFAYLTSTIEAYEAEQARVCAEFPQCRTDGGVRKAYVDVLDNFSADWAHLNAKGQAAEAELIWPVVKEMLGL